jgi:hypothetical protein
MDISGSLHANLRAALQSARRLREGPVHPDTVDHWTQLVAVAKDDESALETFSTRELMKDLEKEISARQASGK